MICTRRTLIEVLVPLEALFSKLMEESLARFLLSLGYGLPEEGNGPQRLTYVFPWMSAAQVTLWRIPEVVERMFSGLDPASTLHLVQANLNEQGDPPEESLFESLEACCGRLKR